MTQPADTSGLRAEVALDAHAEVAEGPVWDVKAGQLVWVDIPRGEIHRFDPTEGTDQVTQVGQPVGALALRARGGLLLAVRDGFAELADGQLRMIAEVESDRSENRMNDGKVDPAGRFWAGTMALDSAPGAGALYRLDTDRSVETMLTGLTISNGIDWSPDGTTMYFIDSTPGTVTAYAYDRHTGAISEPRTALEIPPDDGMPDGMTVDSEGCLWVAIWGGSAVRRYAPDGKQLARVELPATQVTSCAFGGADLRDLYITTASVGLSAAERAGQPHAGALFCVRTEVGGREPNRCQI
ncbi:MAG: SMP-30/gluconolactonase/LRE family protein [Geodermatophilaceae bacterium]|nr:SMP-30/gluconolactonase/LRE family protein [Geodermatophilaceae bacterium]